MQNILAKINTLGDAYTGRPTNAEEIIFCQRRLRLNNRPAIPADYVKLLHTCNALSYAGSHLLGINPRSNTELDILSENALWPLPEPVQTLILGFDELELFVWNAGQNVYQTIDKDSFQVLNTYKNCATALWDFLKLSDDIEYIR